MTTVEFQNIRQDFYHAPGLKGYDAVDCYETP